MVISYKKVNGGRAVVVEGLARPTFRGNVASTRLSRVQLPDPTTFTACLPPSASPFPNPAVNEDCFMVANMQKQYHYKTFVSEDQFLMVLETLRGLRESDFYWSAITGKEAGIVLARQAPGTFLIRESSDRQHLFTLSVKTKTGTKNLRIVCEEDSFHLQTDPGNVEKAPRFNCVPSAGCIVFMLCNISRSEAAELLASIEQCVLSLKTFCNIVFSVHDSNICCHVHLRNAAS
uniref:Suppressor of cytokine signaling 3a n=1 Tax=Xiphophorus couchianus TaxID=32473 RepID=A0A3B5LSQ0_9TELE